MNTRHLLIPLLASSLLYAAGASAERGPGWDAGAELIYQDSQDISFDGGTRASLDDDLGLALTFGYRFSDRLELIFGLDWNNVDYDVHVVGDTALSTFDANGELEAFTPYVGLNFNLMQGDFTPYITGAVGWSFIDTNIPDGPPQSACWWDPWWGYVCGSWQETRNIDELNYRVGIGARWDVSDVVSLRLGYEKSWIDVGKATSTPDFDQLKFGVMARY